MYIYLQDFINLEFKRQHFVQKYFAWKGLMKKEFLHLVFFHSLISVKHNCMCKIIDSNTLFTKILKSRENVSYLIEKFYIRILKSAELFYSIQKLKRKKKSYLILPKENICLHGFSIGPTKQFSLCLQLFLPVILFETHKFS